MSTIVDNRITIIAGAFAAAWLLSRASAEVARRVLVWHDRRHGDSDPGETAKLVDVKRQETLVALIRTGIAYCGFAAAAVLTLAELIGGVDRLTAIAGASFLLILVGFAVQRVLTDIIAGFAMFAERWYAVGDTVAVSGSRCRAWSRTSPFGARSSAPSTGRPSTSTTLRFRRSRCCHAG